MKSKFVTIRRFAALAAISAASSLAGVAHAQSAQIALTPLNIIGNNSFYNNGNGNFTAGNIFDQQAGNVYDTFGINYWISGDFPPSNTYITVDLGNYYSIADFDLYNTHNGPYGDRGTGAFSIIGGNAVTMDGGNGYELTGQTLTLVSGTLQAAPVSDPIAAQNFASANTSAVRYLEFLPMSATAVNGTFAGSYGLNELKVYGALGMPGGTSVSGVPEPASWAMMIVGFGMVGAGLRQRRRQPMVRYI